MTYGLTLMGSHNGQLYAALPGDGVVIIDVADVAHPRSALLRTLGWASHTAFGDNDVSSPRGISGSTGNGSRRPGWRAQAKSARKPVADNPRPRHNPTMNNDQDDLVNCVGCGEAVTPAVDRVFAVGNDDVLCMTCCLSRGGVYDEEEDRWIDPPRVDDLLVAMKIIET
jgi:hypothetical protein